MPKYCFISYVNKEIELELIVNKWRVEVKSIDFLEDEVKITYQTTKKLSETIVSSSKTEIDLETSKDRVTQLCKFLFEHKDAAEYFKNKIKEIKENDLKNLEYPLNSKIYYSCEFYFNTDLKKYKKL